MFGDCGYKDMTNRQILIVEDDISFGTMLQKWFGTNGYACVLVTSVGKAKEEITAGSFQLVLTDLRLPDGDGIMLLSWIRETNKQLPVIIMTGYAEVQSAVAAMKIGAYDYLEKPINPTILKQKIEQVFTAAPTPAVPVTIAPEEASGESIVYGDSASARQLYDHIRLVAPTNLSVLITGESGTGKEYAARMIHRNSRRAGAPFIAVDCGSLSRELAPSELFGHLKGSFTSAIANKTGVFEQAQGGTVFLDEVGNLPYDVQVQLLRTLQERTVRPVGSATGIRVDIRIIVATNEDLRRAILAGRFREDLYHRLNEFSIEMPPLRERVEDITAFANHFLQKANEELEQQVQGFTPEVLHIFKQYNWSGNLREMGNVIRRAVLFTRTGFITPDTLPPLLATNTHEKDLITYSGDEEKKIRAALQITHGNKAAAARLLKIDRKTLYNKLSVYKIED